MDAGVRGGRVNAGGRGLRGRAGAAAVSGVAPAPEREHEASSRAWRIVGWVALGLGAASAAGGLWMASTNADDGAALQRDPENGGLRDDVDSSHTAAQALWGTAAVLATAGTVLVVTF